MTWFMVGVLTLPLEDALSLLTTKLEWLMLNPLFTKGFLHSGTRDRKRVGSTSRDW
nr:hypothetical protein Iba_chr07cCG11200 [Ipomoea batatas]